MKPTEARDIVLGVRNDYTGDRVCAALAMAADALEAPVDGREWISVKTPPEEEGFYDCVVRGPAGDEPREARRRFTGDREWDSIAEVLFYLPNTTPPIPEMPKYEWSQAVTPKGSSVEYETPAGGIMTVRVLDWSGTSACVRESSGCWVDWGPDEQAARRIISIDLPKPAPVDPRVVDFVRGVRGLLLSKTVLGPRDWYAISQSEVQVTLRLLQDAEEAIAVETDA